MGLPLIATPVIAGVFGPRAAVVIVSIPIFVTNSLLIVAGWRSIPHVVRELVPMLVLGAIGTLVGVQLLAKMNEDIFAIVISAIVVAFLLRGDRLLGDDPGSRRITVAGPLVGLVGGVLQGSTSIASPLVGSYFHARKVAPAVFVVSLASLFELNSIIQIGSFVGLRLFTPDLFALGVVGLVPNLVGLLAGIELRGRISAVAFRRIIVVLLIVSVVNLMRTVVR
ncbi:MAG: sulfite exporter TauE/SafE family protein [Chloroflexota bacterium]|nr:sulfite exporter TauE/SafE family protein [Chloroflexota bacterium]